MNNTNNELTNNELQDQVNHIAQQLQEGITFEESGIGNYEDRGLGRGDIISGIDWLEDALDIEWTISSTGDFLGARVLVAFGGPNIWVDTRRCTVEGHWWGDHAVASFNDDPMGIHEACAEWFACTFIPLEDPLLY